MIDVRKTINVTKTTLPSLPKYVRYLKSIWKNNWITNRGELSIKLEKKLERYLRVKNLLVVANGTLALHLSFKALKLKGEVITTPFTFSATTNAIVWEGLTPVFADIDPNTFNIDPTHAEKKITKKTKAILAVHVFGNPCDNQRLTTIAKKHNLKLIYDAAHAFGIEERNKSILSWGDISSLSFHAAKMFHTAEGGAIITKNKKIYEQIELIRNHGIKEFIGPVELGTNAKMNELQAAMGLSVLDIFEKERLKRERIYKKYLSYFSQESKIKLQKLNPMLTKFTFPYFPIVFANEATRDHVYDKLLKKGIYSRKYFYPPLHELPYIKYKSKDLPNATIISHTILCLPLYGDLPIKIVEKIIKLIYKELK